MILRRLFTLTALTVAALLSLSDRASANYDVSTTVTAGNITGTGVTGITPIAPGGTFVIGVTTITAANGGTQFTDGGGSTVYLVNYFSPNNTAGSLITPSELVYVKASGADSSTFSFTDTITVTNPSTTGSTGFFSQSASYTLSVSGGGGSATGSPTGLTPPSITVNGNVFNISNPQVTSATANNTNPGAVSSQITAIPEPTSVVMLGIGLVGVVGVGLRRRKRQI